ncbi:MAG: hypothetical protein Kow0029_30070 [Candidatus Rifleibacteriota bacterium]
MRFNFNCRSLLFFFLFFGLIAPNRLNAAPIGFEEKFGLAKNRYEVLNELVPGTEDFYYYSCLYYQQNGNDQKVEKILKQWIKRYGYTERANEIINRQALLEYSSKPDDAIDLIRRRLNLHFNHQKKQMSAVSSYPSTLSHSIFSFETLMDKAMHDYSDLSGFEDSALPFLIEKDLNPDLRRNLLSRLARPEGKNLAKLVVDDLKYKYSGGFGSLKIHQKLLIDQLDECLRLMPELIDQTNFVYAYISRLRPSEDANWQYDKEVKYRYLMEMWQFAKKLSPAFNSLKAHIVYHLLDLDRQSGRYNKLLFIEYLKLPRYADYTNKQYCESKENRYYRADLNANFRNQTFMPAIGNDEALVREYLENFLVNEDQADAYFKFIDSNYLMKLFAETKIKAGIGDMEKWFSLLSPNEVRALKEKVELEFAPTNPTILKPGEKVRIEFKVKNIKKLIARIYRINTFNYYRQNKEEISTAIDLDGLVANEEKILEFHQPEYISHHEKIEFPELPARGIFIIELIGNGISSRALIRKGQLMCISKPGAAGQLLSIFNESKEKIKDAKVWLDGREFTADEEGLINIPYSTSPGLKKIIIIKDDFASINEFEHLSERYSLEGGFYVDRESLIARKKAKVVFRPRLSLNGEKIDVSLLKDVVFKISSRDFEGAESSIEISHFKLYNNRESVHEFSVPEKLSQLSFTLKAKIDNLSTGKTDDLSVSETFFLNQIAATDKTEAFFPKHVKDSYKVYLLGKTGEPVRNESIQVELKSRYFTRTVYTTMQTDENGSIDLGKLQEIAWVKISTNSGISTIIRPTAHFHSLPEVINASIGQKIQIPLPFIEDRKPNEIFNLYEVRDNDYVADFSKNAQISRGFINIEHLPAGDFELFLKDTQSVVKISIANGTGQTLTFFSIEGLFRDIPLLALLLIVFWQCFPCMTVHF